MKPSPIRDALQHLLDAPWPVLDPLPPTGTELVIYGAGNCGRHIQGVLSKHGYRVAAFIDSRADAIGAVASTPCFAPDRPEARALAARGLAVVVGVFNYQADLHAIDSLLRNIGFRQVVSYYALNEHLPAELPSLYWLVDRSFYQDKKDAILGGFDLLDDDISRQVYLDLMKLRLTYDLSVLREPLRENQYFLPELFQDRKAMRLVDGGAFTGDTLEFFLEKQLPIEAVAAFEPDPGNFRRLSAFARKEQARLGEVTLFPCGLDEMTTGRRFHSQGLSSSAISDQGDSFIQVAALDEVLPCFAPTLIKLDIEGAELAALRGAAHTIRTHGPDLAICVYHAPEHLWEIPALMRELLPAHKLALRYHQLTGFEVVAYAYRAA